MNNHAELGTLEPSERDRPAAVPGVHDVVQLALGEKFSCALLRSGALTCWGENVYDWLGNGAPGERTAPAAMRNVERVVAIAAGRNHVCALLVDHTVSCRGRRDARVEPSPVLLKDAVEIGSGAYHACALLRDGSVWCWGMNSSGQLGDGTDRQTAAPVRVTVVGQGSGLIVGGRTSCLHVEGTLRCWGDDPRASGSAGLGRPWSLDAFADSASVSIDESQMCATSREGTLRCVDPAHPTPRAIATTAHAGQVAVGSGHACARLEGDRFVCWGSNGSGQVGDGSLAGRLPVLVDGPVKVTQLVAHGNATCARGASGRLWCWGLTHAKHVASTGFSPGPFLVPVANVGRLAMGSHVDCAVLGDGALMCWGDNQWGQIPGVAKEVWVPPTRVPMASGALDATIGSTHACMLDRSGGVTCWGENRVGEVGVGRTSAFEGPTLVRPLPHVAWLHAIGAFTLARSSTGPVHFWGGRNGNPHDAMADADITPTPKEAPLLAGAAELSSFFDHRGCLRSAKGDVSCWEGGDFEHPAPFPAIQDVSDIAVGREHACAVRTDKSLWCWGHNGSGQLGDGTTTDRAAPVRARLDGVLEVVAGERHTCALREDGHVACWGRGSVGQRGDGVTQVRATPAEVLMDKEL